MDTDQINALDSHNKIRVQVGVQPLEWSGELAHQAKIWAKYLASVEIGLGSSWLRPRDADQGENVTVFMPSRRPSSEDAPLTELTRNAYREKRNWHGGKIRKGCGERCRHGQYTQVCVDHTTLSNFVC